jgi:hypothetical protein
MAIQIGDRVLVGGVGGGATRILARFNGLEGEAIRIYWGSLWWVAFPNRSAEVSSATVDEKFLTVIRPEVVCRNRTCGKMNDVGVARCWNCGAALVV